MPLQGLDDTKLLVLMGAGLLFALAGLYLLVRPPQGDGQTRVELLGFKFNASSAGLVVFLVGAAFLVLPVFVPKASHVQPVDPGSNTALAPTDQSPTSAPLAPLDQAERKEIEPNDSRNQAQRIEVGESVSGLVYKSSPDWFGAKVDPDEEFLYIKLRNPGGSHACHISIYSADEKNITPSSFNLLNHPHENTADVHEISLERTPAVFVLFEAYGRDPCNYELFTSYSEQ